MKTGIAFLLAMTMTAPLSARAEEQQPSGPPSDMKVKIEEAETAKSDFGFAPIAAYSPTYGFIAGAAAFVFPREGKRGLDAHLVVVDIPATSGLSANLAYQNDLNKNWGYNFEGGATTFFTPYYGEGDRTPARDLKYNQRFYKAHEGLTYYLNNEDSMEGFVETRSRIDLGLDDDPSQHLTANQTRTAAGFNFTRDTRDSLVNSKKGLFAQAQIYASPAGGSADSFAALELEARKFFTLNDRLVLGVRGEAAATVGQSDYNFRYNLGGIERLRGYQVNRFRGDQYYLTGGEIRQDLWKDYVQVVAFTDIGDIKDQDHNYSGPRAAYGAGLRVGLPPDWDMKFRVDFAKGNDQKGIFATFGQAF